MKIILICGGKGKRLWPLSTESTPKQFIPLYDNSESMLLKTYQEVTSLFNKKDIYIATIKQYKKEIKKEIKHFNNIIIEPDYIGTLGAVFNIAIYLKEEKKIDENEVIAILPIDHDADVNFYKNLYKANEIINKGISDLCLIGIKPTFPSIHYGYINSENGLVTSFKEKPNIEEATKLLANNALWNTGINIFKLKKVIDVSKNYLNYQNYKDFKKNYHNLPHTSFEYEVLEKEKNISVISSNSSWNDLGTWDRLALKLSPADEFNTSIINYEDKKIINEGVKNVILVNTSHGIKLLNKTVNDTKFYSWGYIKHLNTYNNNETTFTTNQITIFKDNIYKANKSSEYFISSGKCLINNKIINTGENIHLDENTEITALTFLEIIEVTLKKN